MSNDTYHVLFKGIVPGFETFIDDIKPEFGKRFGLSARVVNRLFASETRTIKKNVDLELAKRLCEVLREMGIDWEIVDKDGNAVDVELKDVE